MSKDLQEAKKRATEEGVIAPKNALQPEEVRKLVESGEPHPDPVLNYLVTEARKIEQNILKQQASLASLLKQTDQVREAITANKGAFQKTLFDIAQLNVYVRDGARRPLGLVKNENEAETKPAPVGPDGKPTAAEA